MIFSRLWRIFRLCTLRNSNERADYLRKNKVFGMVGKRVWYQPRMIPIYPELIKLHNNIIIGRNVEFIVHDGMHKMFNVCGDGITNDYKFKEAVGCIEIEDNVFIGAHTRIMYDVKIGPNVIIGACSFVVKDCEPNSVYAGVPAKKVGTFKDFLEKRRFREINKLQSSTVHNQHLTAQDIEDAWNNFYRKHPN